MSFDEWTHIMTYLDDKTIISLTLVNRYISNAARSNATWETRMPTTLPPSTNIRALTALNSKKKAAQAKKQQQQQAIKHKIETLRKGVADILKFVAFDQKQSSLVRWT